MKHRRKAGGSDVESSEDEHIIEPHANDVTVEYELEEDEDYLVNSQDATQIIPKWSNTNLEEEGSSSKRKKKKKKSKRASSSPEPAPEPLPKARSSKSKSRHINGFRVREMEVSEIPAHILASMKKVVPKESDSDNRLTSVEVQTAIESKDDGVWIIKCPRDVKLSDLLPEKFQLDLDQGSSISLANEDDDSSAQLTQFVPTTSLGVNVKDRQFEATHVSTDEYKNGAILMLPDVNEFQLVAAPIKGHIIIRECVKELPLPQISTHKSKRRKLPKGIKERHPIYGADFTKIVNEMESAPKKKRKSYEPEPDYSYTYTNGHEKVSNEEVDSGSSRKKKKKDKHCDVMDYSIVKCENGFDDNVIEEEVSSSRKKKSKKRKREELEESFENLEQTILIESSEPVRKKSKKSKHK